MKKVTVYLTTGKNMKEFETNATTWKELQGNLNEFQIPFSGMKAVISENRLTVESDDAILPEGDFTLFLMPIKVKSGSERSDLFDQIKAWVGKDAERKQKFIIDGKNMTQLSTDKLKELAAKYIGGSSTPAPAVKAEPKAPKTTVKETAPVANVADVVASVGGVKELEEAVEKAKKAYQKAVAADVDEATQDLLLDKLTAAKAALKGYVAPAKAPKTVVEAPKETPEQIAKREALEAENKKKAALHAQAQNIAKGLKGLASFS